MQFFTCSSGNGCNPFSDANAKTDTVKVVVPPQHEKENAAPNQKPPRSDFQKKDAQAAEFAAAETSAEKERKRVRAEREKAEKEARRLEAELAAAEQRALAAERVRREEKERAAAEAAAEQRREEERLQAEQEAREAREQAEREEQERREAEARREKEELEKAQRDAEQKSIEREKVKQFLLEHGYLGVNAKRTKMMKSKYPLHTAVKLADQEMVLLLLSCGADPNLKNSSGETPHQLARRLNKNGSHDGVKGALPGPSRISQPLEWSDLAM